MKIATRFSWHNLTLLNACMGASMLVLSSAALAQTQPQAEPQPTPPPAATPAPSQNPLNAVGKWFEKTFSIFGSGIKDAQGNIENFNREAGAAAKTAGGAAKEAADAVARLPGVRMVRGHANCARAANGAPDCVSAANNLCKGQGFGGGTSVDMTTAEDCPVPVLMGRRAAEPGECKSVTFVTRAMCQ